MAEMETTRAPAGAFCCLCPRSSRGFAPFSPCGSHWGGRPLGCLFPSPRRSLFLGEATPLGCLFPSPLAGAMVAGDATRRWVVCSLLPLREGLGMRGGLVLSAKRAKSSSTASIRLNTSFISTPGSALLIEGRPFLRHHVAVRPVRCAVTRLPLDDQLLLAR